MKTYCSWKDFFAHGLRWRAEPEWANEFFYYIDGEYDDEDAYPLREDIKEWLDRLPRGRWWIENTDGYNLHDHVGPRWIRPIYFRYRRDLMMFKLRWEYGKR